LARVGVRVVTMTMSTTYDCGTCGTEESVHRVTHGRVCSLWRCDNCDQEWVWENAPTLYDSHCPECRHPSDPTRGGDHRDH